MTAHGPGLHDYPFVGEPPQPPPPPEPPRKRWYRRWPAWIGIGVIAVFVTALIAGLAGGGRSGGTTVKPAASPPAASQSAPESMVGGGTGGGAHGGGTAQPGTPIEEAPNPVDLLRKIPGIQLPASAQVGASDAYGDRYASGKFPRGESVVVYTNTSDEAVQANSTLISDDAHKVIVGSKFVAIYTGTFGENGGYDFSTAPAKIAAYLGGELR